ncbi:MAG: aconitase X catalytic domain-containing protein, partial [Halanaerobiales bacterium]|nr:aconitase X catalytic domain-containing protein [Halanaerobiales bacterium]
GWENCSVWPQSDHEYHKKSMQDIKPFIKMGMVPILSCDYYLVSSYWPTAGQHCSWGESSAIPWANAVLGARTNADGCFQTAYLGKVPAYDMHLDENRAATRLVECKVKLESDMDYDLLGWTIGEKIGVEVPAIVGIGKPTISQLVKMNSSLNTGGQVRMYHIPKVTPEASSLSEAFKGNDYVEKIEIKEKDLKDAYEKMNYASDRNVDFVYLGCPHYNIQEIQKVAHLINGKKCNTRLWVMTNPWTYKVAESMGYKDIIEKAGGTLMSGTCPGALATVPKAEVMATDAAKQSYYITGHLDPKPLDVWYGTVEDCINAPVTGKWKGDWRDRG